MTENSACPENQLYRIVLLVVLRRWLACMDALRSRVVQSVRAASHTSDQNS
jgi:hypothetical protein